jgi:GNAT superfamily N-acetyltransferase
MRGEVKVKRMVSIRTAGVGDAAVLAELGRQTFHDTFADQNAPEDMDAYMREAFTVERLTSELQEPGAVYLIAENPPKAIGFAKIVPSEPPACISAPSPLRLVKLYVSADAIGTGVGAALMRASIEQARESGYESLWLGVWEHNLRARAFYERWGFVPVGTETFLLGNDQQTDVLMQRALIDGAG